MSPDDPIYIDHNAITQTSCEQIGTELVEATELDAYPAMSDR